jgi:ABC-type transport system involved in multi-copper enzyme maturation permease subunit
MGSQAPVKGSIPLLFSTLTRRDGLYLIVAVVLAIVAGVVPAIMAKIIGVAFKSFTDFNTSGVPIDDIPQERND